ncbi:alpha/beta hydrolase family protein [Neobacillus dielmonensis]|uniref:alpha/beta hydrolase family protein n=1 Tax=Neobacillus dielmonensis TaxID=1347369 RepID=UPI0005AAEBAE|nr:alpha/beta fold hydrolase [Neobacillus dielmonensis]
MKRLKKPIVWIAISLVLILAGSIFASLFNNSYGKTDVSRIHFKTPSGELSGLLYKPEGADKEPRPTIITTHGYLNSAEMQDAQAIEMSKRGYVVLALDQYDHGHSTGKMKKPVPFFSFWPTSMYDAVQYMYEQDFVLKDKAGNGIIGVSGHSMGGFSSTNAVVLDEKEFQKSGIRKIYSSLTMGSDYLWLHALKNTDEDINNSYGPRTSGKVAAQYDEFFFDAAAEATGKTVVKKNYVGTPEGSGFLGNPKNPQAGQFYDVNGGKRIVYQPAETHPWNHFSKEATSDAIDFYNTAFSDYSDLVSVDKSGQTWMYKEFFEFIALIGFFLLFIPLIMLISKLPFFNKIYTKKPEPLSVPTTNGAKAANYLIVLFGALFPALFFSSLYGGNANEAFFGMRLLRQVSIILMVISAIVMIISFVKKSDKTIKTCSAIMLVLSAVQYIYLKYQAELIATTPFFGSPTTNPVVYWAINVAIVTLMLMVCYHYVTKKPEGATIANYGVKVNVLAAIAAIANAIVAVVIGFAILFIIDAVFKTDFRLWTFAVKTFEGKHVIALLKYAPLFFIYYFISGISTNMNTSGKKFDGIKGYIISILLYVGGLILYLGYQYGLLFVTGTAGYPEQALSSIIVIALVPVLMIAAIFNRFLYRLTGNVYVGAVLNTLLFTMITVANSTLYTIF